MDSNNRRPNSQMVELSRGVYWIPAEEPSQPLPEDPCDLGLPSELSYLANRLGSLMASRRSGQPPFCWRRLYAEAGVPVLDRKQIRMQLQSILLQPQNNTATVALADMLIGALSATAQVTLHPAEWDLLRFYIWQVVRECRTLVLGEPADLLAPYESATLSLHQKIFDTLFYRVSKHRPLPVAVEQCMSEQEEAINSLSGIDDDQFGDNTAQDYVFGGDDDDDIQLIGGVRPSVSVYPRRTPTSTSTSTSQANVKESRRRYSETTTKAKERTRDQHDVIDVETVDTEAEQATQVDTALLEKIRIMAAQDELRRAIKDLPGDRELFGMCWNTPRTSDSGWESWQEHQRLLDMLGGENFVEEAEEHGHQQGGGRTLREQRARTAPRRGRPPGKKNAPKRLEGGFQGSAHSNVQVRYARRVPARLYRPDPQSRHGSTSEVVYID